MPGLAFNNLRVPWRWRWPCMGRWSREQWHTDAALRRYVAQQDRVIVDFTTDPVDNCVEDQFRDLAHELGIDHQIIYLTSNWQRRDLDSSTVWWPRMIDLLIYHHRDLDLPQVQPRIWRVGMLNGMPRPHRFLALHLLEQADLDQDAVVVCHGLRHLWQGVDLDPEHEWFQDLPHAVRERLAQDAYRRTWPGSGWQEDFHGITHAAFDQCALNLVTETDTGDSISVTEKSIKPLLAGQLWITIGQHGMIALLADLGFECMTSAIDHARYEACRAWQDRVHEAIKVLGEISPDLHDIYRDQAPALLHNQGWARSADLRARLRQGLRQHDLIIE